LLSLPNILLRYYWIAMKKIAIVEDYVDNLEVLEGMLEGNYEVCTYVCGQDALGGISRDQPDLIIMDIGLPDIEGDQVLQGLRQRKVFTPAIALTAHAMKGEEDRLLAAGFAAYLTKPILDDTLLIHAIERCLSASD